MRNEPFAGRLALRLGLAALAVTACAAFAAPLAGAAEIHLDSLADEVPMEDNDVCTLREAILEANEDSQISALDCHFVGVLGDDTIVLPPGTVTMTGPNDSAIEENENQSGDYDVEIQNGDSLTIRGAGAQASAIDAAGRDRVFDLIKKSSIVLGERRFTLEDVTVTGGHTVKNGGGIRGADLASDDSHVTLDHAAVSGNRADIGGGGIYAADSFVDLVDSRVSGNRVVATTTSAGGGIWVTGTNGGAGAGVTSLRSSISGNTMEPGVGGGSLLGGGVYIRAFSATSTQMSASFVDTTIANNIVKAGGQGAGINTLDTTVVMKRSTVSGNRQIPVQNSLNTSTAGMIFRDGNTSQAANDHLSIDNSTFAENDSGPTTSTNNDAAPAGLSVSSGIARLSSLTFFGNLSGGDAKDISAGGGASGSSMRIRNSILGDPGACSSFLASDGGNLEVGGSTCNFQGGAGTTPGANGDRENLTPAMAALAALAPNGGPTQTVGLGGSSVAVNAVPAGQCLDSTGAAQTSDQRGVDRPSGACDSGAYELSFCQGAPVTLIGTPGDDVLEGTSGADVVAAGDGNDVINTFGGADRVCAGDGNDTVNVGPDQANDSALAEGGTDTLDYGDATSGVSADLGAGTATGQGTDTVSGFENLVGSDGDDTLRGSNDPNLIRGNDGADTIVALGGADSIFARDGISDSVDCGDDTDAVQSDTPGTDLLTACETSDLMPAPNPPKTGDTPPPSPPAGDTTPPVGKPSKKCKKKRKKGKKATVAKKKKGCKKK